MHLSSLAFCCYRRRAALRSVPFMVNYLHLRRVDKPRQPFPKSRQDRIDLCYIYKVQVLRWCNSSPDARIASVYASRKATELSSHFSCTFVVGIKKHRHIFPIWQFLVGLVPRVGARGFEPPTSCTPCKRASRAAPRPDWQGKHYSRI